MDYVMWLILYGCRVARDGESSASQGRIDPILMTGFTVVILFMELHMMPCTLTN